MMQIHPQARTTPAVRAEIARSTEPARILAKRYGISEETVRKWRKRGEQACQDRSSRPQRLPWRVTEEERAIICAVRRAMTASRRLHLAAKGSGTTGIALRRWRRQQDAYDLGQPTAAMTRWRISVLPSASLPVPSLGRARWLIELIRARAGESFDIELEACDGTGHLGHPAALADRPAQAVDS